MSTDNIETVGAVVWDELFLTLAGRATVDLRPFVQHIKIYENIGQHCLFVELAIKDSTNIIGKLDLDGTNTVTLKVRSPFLNDDDAIHKTFSVFSISDRLIEDDRKQYFILNLISLEGMKDLSTRFSKRLTGSTEAIAAQVFNDTIAEPRYRDTDGGFSEPSTLTILGTPHKTNNFSFNANNWSAFETMDFISKNSEPGDYNGKSIMPNGLFFETRTKFVMGSFMELILKYKESAMLYDEYSYVPVGDIPFMNDTERTTSGSYNYTSPFISQKYCTASRVDMKNYFNELHNQVSGYYGSTTIGIDMINRLNYQMVFDYTDNLAGNSRGKINKSYNDFAHLADERPTSTNPIFSPAAVTTVKIASSNLYEDSDFGYDINHFERLTYRNTAVAEIKRLSLKIEVPGKTDVEVGKLIKFNYPSVGDKTKGMPREELFDPKISGIYAIAGIVHNITQDKHTMTLEIVRDSFGEE